MSFSGGGDTGHCTNGRGDIRRDNNNPGAGINRSNDIGDDKNGYIDHMNRNHFDADGKLLRPYDMSEMMEMTQTTQPLIGFNDRDANGYKDRISGSSRYASTTSTLADEKL